MTDSHNDYLSVIGFLRVSTLLRTTNLTNTLHRYRERAQSTTRNIGYKTSVATRVKLLSTLTCIFTAKVITKEISIRESITTLTINNLQTTDGVGRSRFINKILFQGNERIIVSSQVEIVNISVKVSISLCRD